MPSPRSAVLLPALPVLLLAGAAGACRAAGAAGPAEGAVAPAGWRAELARRLPLLGHRNYVVVADSAYPAQTSPGITTLATGEDHLTVLRAVLAAVDAAPHVAAAPYLDRELGAVAEADAPGIEALRAGLADALAGHAVEAVPHADLIVRLDEAGERFDVLVLKTTCTLPYTSVFLELGCAYWTPEAEERLRDALSPGGDEGTVDPLRGGAEG